MNEPAIEVRDVGKRFRLYHERNQSLKSAFMRRKVSDHEDFWALRDVSFTIPEGTTYGLIGSNGSGKSTLLKCLAKILYPDEGTISSHGRLAALLEVGSGFHPELSGRENIYLNGSILGMKRHEIDSKFDEIVDFSGIAPFIDQPVKNYSSGMYVRLGFSVAINVDPDILVVDEILAVGDAEFQEKCNDKFADFKRRGKTVVLVSHSLPTVSEMCDEAAWIEKGALRFDGAVDEAIGRYSSDVYSVAPELTDYVESTHTTEAPLGWPVSSAARLMAHGGGVVQSFRNGAAAWTPGTGAVSIRGPIRTFFNEVGGIEGPVGWPISDAEVDGDGTTRQQFTNGQVEVPPGGLPRLVMDR